MYARLVNLVVCLCSLEYVAAGSTPYDAPRYLLEDDPGPPYAPGFSTPPTPETGYGYVIVQPSFHHRQEYAPAFWEWRDNPPEYRASQSGPPIENEVYGPSFREHIIFPDRGFFDPQTPFESNPYFLGVNPKPMAISRNPIFTPVMPFDGVPNTYSDRYPYTPSSTPLPPRHLGTNPIFKPVSTPTVIPSKTPNIVRGESYGGSDTQTFSNFYPYKSSSETPPFQSLKPIYGSIRPPLTLASTSPNIIRGESESFTVTQKLLEEYPYNRSWKPPLSDVPTQNTIPNYNLIINREGLSSVSPNIIRGRVPDQTLPEGKIHKDDFSSEFESRVNPPLYPLTPLQRTVNVLNPFLSSPNIIRGEGAVAVSRAVLPPISSSSPFSTATPGLSPSLDESSIFTSNPVDTVSPTLAVSSSPPSSTASPILPPEIDGSSILSYDPEDTVSPIFAVTKAPPVQ